MNIFSKKIIYSGKCCIFAKQKVDQCEFGELKIPDKSNFVAWFWNKN